MNEALNNEIEVLKLELKKEKDKITMLEAILKETAPDGKGGLLTQLSYKKPLKDPQGNIIRIMSNTVDVTHLKLVESNLRKTKEELAIANRVKTEFLRNMCHDVRTPMTGIIGCARLIKTLKNNPSKIEEYADSLINSSETLLSFLTQVLDSVRINSGDIPILKKKFDLNSILKQVIRLNQPKAFERNLSLELECDKEIPRYVIGDPKRLYRIILELVTNALKYTNEGYVKISSKLAKKDDDNLVIKIIVEDTGTGISPDKRQDIFVEFKRLTASFQGIYQGTGLGLYLVKEFLKDLRAEIYVTSEINRGSIFTCVIPLKEALLSEEFGVDSNIEESDKNVVVLPRRSKLNDISSTAQTNSSWLGRILLVEDHDITAKITKEFISDLGYQVDVAVDGEMAITLIEKNAYKLVFMDVGLPDINGYEVTQRIRSGVKNKSVPIIGLTAHVSPEDKQHCFDIGMNTVFIKPLMKEKIQDIFDVFVPINRRLEENKSFDNKSDDKALLVLTGEVIDLELGLKLTNGGKALVDEFLSTLVKSFPEELKKLDVAYKSHNWEIVKSILHKLRGGLSYCAVPRLREACVRFDSYLKSGEEELLEVLYQQFLLEFDSVQQELDNHK